MKYEQIRIDFINWFAIKNVILLILGNCFINFENMLCPMIGMILIFLSATVNSQLYWVPRQHFYSFMYVNVLSRLCRPHC